MYISEKFFRDLHLEYGALIYLVTETGEGFTGAFHNGFNGTSFLFSNFSNGKTQTIALDKLQHLEKVKPVSQ
ncbi:hypothetical protein [Mucilaginibacter sp.]|uniref:hypothetical protein n=1 Tax=Mucilaginibacter sp. TaxID=1882438 RepID=UPI00284E1036|nr:hypothetical protein [Mucilaginibacter sp.]MDR3696468.1 hypothetical protein [Mucilaginibacter sp.]